MICVATGPSSCLPFGVAARALAREAVERPEDDDIELPLVRVLEERLESSAAPGGTRFLISIFLDQLPALVTGFRQ